MPRPPDERRDDGSIEPWRLPAHDADDAPDQRPFLLRVLGVFDTLLFSVKGMVWILAAAALVWAVGALTDIVMPRS